MAWVKLDYAYELKQNNPDWDADIVQFNIPGSAR